MKIIQNKCTYNHIKTMFICCNFNTPSFIKIMQKVNTPGTKN